MDHPETLTGFTIQLRVPDIDRGREFYASLLGRPADLSAFVDFHEWELCRGAWLQLGQGAPLPAYPIRLGVADIEQRRREVEETLNIICGKLERIPGLASWCDFSDPWGNRLGFYQDLANGQPAVPGGREFDWPMPGGTPLGGSA